MRGTRIAKVNDVAYRSYAVVGGTGAPPNNARLREATDKATIKKAEGDEATGAASSPLVFLRMEFQATDELAIRVFEHETGRIPQ